MEEPGKAADRMLADGFDVQTAFYALRDLLLSSRAGEANPIDPRMDYDARWAAIWGRQQRIAEVSDVVEADAFAILRAALPPAGPFITIPKHGNAFHLRHRSDPDFIGIEIVADDGLRPGRNVVMLLRSTDHEGGRPAVSQEVIDGLDQEACATIAAEGKPLKKEARAALIQPALKAKGYNLAL